MVNAPYIGVDFLLVMMPECGYKEVMFRLLRVGLMALLGMSGFVRGETLWAAGVNEQGGWFDFDKARDASDSELCWAVTAANLIAWWQTQRVDAVQTGTPVGDKVWQVFRESFSNEGSDPDEAMNWWFSGVYEPQQSPDGLPASVLLRQDSGKYYPGLDWKKLLYRDRSPRVSAAAFACAFAEGFGRGDAFWVGVSFLKPDGKRYTHAITVWGVDCERDAAGNVRLTALYMADSDDRRRTLHRIPLREADGMLLFDCPQHPLYGRIGEITVNNYTGLRVHEAR